jgi:hypothetical protein
MLYFCNTGKTDQNGMGTRSKRIPVLSTRSDGVFSSSDNVSRRFLMNQSLHSFCKQHGLTKSTVYNHLVDLGYDLSQGLTPTALEEAQRAFLKGQDTADQGHTAQTFVLPGHYADPFSGMTPGQAGAMVPAGFQAQNRSLATSAAAQRVQQLCQGANLHAQQTVAAALDSGDQMGQQLGAFLAERTIAAAEQQRQALIQQYLQAQGVQVDPKPEATPDGHAA